MNSIEKPVQKHDRFSLFSLPREVRDNINRALFVSDDFVHYYDVETFSCIPKTYEMLENIYEATSSLQFLQESLETFFRGNVFTVFVEDMPFLLKYRRLSLRSKEQLALPPYDPLEAMKMSTTFLLARPPAMHSTDDNPRWVLDKDLCWVLDAEEEISLVPDHRSCSVLSEDEWNAPKFSPRKALELSTWIRSILVPIAPSRDEKFPEPCLLELCKLPKLQHVTIMTRVDRWPLVLRGERAEAAKATCLKELRARFGTGLRFIYYDKKDANREFQIPNSFIDMLCAWAESGEEEGQWEEDWTDPGEESKFSENWLEEQFHPLEKSLVDFVRSH